MNTISHSSYSTPVIPMGQLPSTDTAAQSPAARRVIEVLHVINGEHFSGAERVQQLLGKTLPNFGVRATFACVKPGKFPELCGLPTSDVLRFAMRGRIDWSVVSRLSKHVCQNGIEILHAHTPRTALVTSLVSLRSGVPWCYHVHSPTARDSTRGFLNRLNLLMERVAIGSCTHLITVSKSLRREMLRLGVSRQRLSVVPNGVPAIEPIDPTGRLDNPQWRLGLIALMRPRKGVEVALDAMARLKRIGRDIQLELIGGFETDEYQQQILSRIKDLGIADRVHWSGFTNDIPSAVRRLDALVLPSLFGEGMPMVVLEALAAGVPVVATRVEGTPEVVRHGVEGFLAEPRNEQSLAEEIERMTSCRSTWAGMSVQALQRHRDRFSDLQMSEKVAAVYDQIVDR